MSRLVIVVVLVVALLSTHSSGDALASVRAAAAMVEGAKAFVSSLAPEQRARAVFPFDHEERFDWHFVPRERRGIPLKDLSAEQRRFAHDFIKTGVSRLGYEKVTAIIELENVLRELGGDPKVRDPERYFLTVFGEPSIRAAWGWRVEGHHLSLNYTVAGGTMIATAPSFFGANPAHVREGSRKGMRPLAREEMLARALVQSLDSEQRAIAVIQPTAPQDIVTGNARQVTPLSPAGLPASRLRADQLEQLKAIVGEYLSRLPDDLAETRREKIAKAGYQTLHFAWAGSLEPDQPHYYRLQGPTFLIEYDNTQNNANHVHTVWRDFDGDFGADLLRQHYASAPHDHGHGVPHTPHP